MTVLETITAASMGAIFKSIAPAALKAISKNVRQTADNISLTLEKTFSPHVISTYNKCSLVQTIFTNDKKVSLKSIYTNLYIEGYTKIRDDDILNQLDKLGNIVLSGTGGAGKTMLMKYLALMAIEYPNGKIPIYIELRNLPYHIPADFYKVIFNYCVDESTDNDYRIFMEGLRKGTFLIFFDGLDEIQSDSRDQIFNSIKRLSRTFSECNVIASTRPEIDTRNWGELTTYNVLGLSINQAKLLIEKIDFPEELKNEFINLIDHKFYSKHISFLSIPLLCSLMLLTYHEYQYVPSRITVFYEQAFETLMRRHDRIKEGHFKRRFDCGLSSDRFRVVFSAFCYRTLAKQQVSFTDDEFRYHLSRASEATEIIVDIDKYASDLVSSVCVIIREGLKLHFIHRSFQEYFSALFMLRYKGPDIFELYTRLFSALNVNDVATMAADIDIQAFEREWAFPACEKLIIELDRFDPEERAIGLLSLAWHTICVSKVESGFSTFSWISGQSYHDTLNHLSKVYGSKYDSLASFCTGETPDGSTSVEFIRRQFPKEKMTKIFEFDEDNDDMIEFRVELNRLGWINETSMYSKLQNSVDQIYDLYRDLKSRIEKRETIDILL